MRFVTMMIAILTVARVLSAPSPLVAETACPDDGNFFTPFKCAEADRIAASSGHVTRRGGELSLTTGAGTVTFSNRDQCGADERPFNFGNCILYIFVRHSLEHHGFLVLTGYYEGYEYRWIDDITGRVTALDDEPRFSPGGDELIESPARLVRTAVEWKREGPPAE